MNAYVSPELSTIKALDTERHRIELAREAFLSKGGAIEVLPFWVSPGEPKKSNTMTPNFQSSAVKDATDQQAARIREMAKTLNRCEICEKEGITLGVLKGIGKRYGIEFTVGPKNAYAPNKPTPEIEAVLVLRIKECIAKGLNRAQCSKLLTISTTLLYRLIKDYDLDYPKMKPAFR